MRGEGRGGLSIVVVAGLMIGMLCGKMGKWEHNWRAMSACLRRCKLSKMETWRSNIH